MGNRSSFNSKTTAEEAINGMDLSKSVCIVTGGNTGIGKETVRVLVKQNATVVIGCRSLDRGNEAKKEIIENLKPTDVENKIIVLELDLSSLKSVQEFAKNFIQLNLPLNYLINNAGVMGVSEYSKTVDGYELHWGTNHLGHFYLTKLLLPTLLKSTPRRVINVGALASNHAPNPFPQWVDKHYECKNGPLPDEEYGPWHNYSLSKACNLLFTRELSRRYHSQGVITVCLHPGVFQSELGRHFAKDHPWLAPMFYSVSRAFLKSIEQGAATTVRCISLADNEIVTGAYYSDCVPAEKDLRKDLLASDPSTPIENTSEWKLWELTEQCIKSSGFDY